MYLQCLIVMFSSIIFWAKIPGAQTTCGGLFETFYHTHLSTGVALVNNESWEMSPSRSKIYMCMKHKSIHLFHTYKYMYFKYMDYMHETVSGRSCTPWTDTVRDFIDNGHMWCQLKNEEGGCWWGFDKYEFLSGNVVVVICTWFYDLSHYTHWICILLICRLWFENGRLLPLCLE